jgi:hypothetical protein
MVLATSSCSIVGPVLVSKEECLLCLCLAMDVFIAPYSDLWASCHIFPSLKKLVSSILQALPFVLFQGEPTQMAQESHAGLAVSLFRWLPARVHCRLGLTLLFSSCFILKAVCLEQFHNNAVVGPDVLL